MRKALHTALLLLMLLTAAGCDFRDLRDPGNVSYVRLYVDEHILNVTEGFYDTHVYENILGLAEGTYTSGITHPAYNRPEIMRIALFNHDTGELAAERYLRNQGDDERGHYYDGYIVLNPGVYDLVAYNFGTESTVIGDEYNSLYINAHTNELSPALASKFKSRAAAEGDTKADESIRYDADPLFVTSYEALKVDRHEKVDTLKTAEGDWYFVAKNRVKAYYMQIGIINAQYVASSSGRRCAGARQLQHDTRRTKCMASGEI